MTIFTDYVLESKKIRDDLLSLGFRIMHRREHKYWLMFDKPMTLAELDHFAATGFMVQNGEQGHLRFDSVPDNAWRRDNGWGAPGSRPFATERN
jgi:hypothetical protein